MAAAFIVFLVVCFLLAMKKEIEKFKAIRKYVGQPVSAKEVFIYVIILATPFVLFVLYKYKISLFLMLR